MAFDLLKLQILQEARDLAASTVPSEGMCMALAKSCVELAGRHQGLRSKDVVPEVIDIIIDSVERRERCAPFLDNPREKRYIEYGFLWIPGFVGACNRVAYLDRLIEDEMSGTYFIKDDYYGIRPS